MGMLGCVKMENEKKIFELKKEYIECNLSIVVSLSMTKDGHISNVDEAMFIRLADKYMPDKLNMD